MRPGASLGPSLGPIGDDYNYTASDPGSSRWENIVQEPDSCNPGPCHDMWVQNLPGYLFSDNKACVPTIDPSSTRSGCGRDALMDSYDTLPYDASSGLRLILREKTNPDIHDKTLCPIWDPSDPVLHGDDWVMHAIGLRYADDPAGSFVRIAVEHTCSWADWHLDLRAWYRDASGIEHFDAWTDRVIQNGQWLVLNMEVKDNGQHTVLSATNISNGQTYSTTISTKLGTRNGLVEIEVQYRHNESSRTGSVDFRIAQNDCGSLADAGDSFNTALSIAAGTCEGSLKSGPDTDDWFKFFACCSQSILVSLYSPQSGVVVELYDPGGSRHDCVSIPCFWPAQWGDGDYRIRLFSASWSGTYNFGLSFPEPPGGGGCGGCYRNCCPMQGVNNSKETLGPPPSLN